MNKKIKSLVSWIGIIAIVLTCSLFLQSEVFAGVTVNQSSMKNTLIANQRLIIDKLSYQFSEPERGDIIVFLKNGVKGSTSNEMHRNMELFMNLFMKKNEINEKHEMYVKRVIGIPGDTVDIKDGFVYVNGNKLTEDYVKGTTFAGEITLPLTVEKNQVFVMGDNREVSVDSRAFGTVDYDRLEGKVAFRIFPLNKVGTVK